MAEEEFSYTFPIHFSVYNFLLKLIYHYKYGKYDVAQYYYKTKTLPKTLKYLNVEIGDGVSFKTNSILNSAYRCAHFLPYNKSKGIKISYSTKVDDEDKDYKNLFIYCIQNCLNDMNAKFTIYFKYRINSIDMDEITPIISYEEDDKIIPLLYIKNKSYFAYTFKNNYTIYSRNSEHTFNGKWHTFCLTRLHGIYRFFIDGLLVSQYELKEYHNVYQEIPKTSSLYIGYCKTDKEYTFNNGYMDDISIANSCMTTNTFIPPDVIIEYPNDTIHNFTYNSDYLKTSRFTVQSHVLYNYLFNKKLSDIQKEILKEYDEDFINALKKIYESTKHKISEKITTYNLIPLEFSWNITNYFYNDGNLIYATDDDKYKEYVFIEISDLNILFNTNKSNISYLNEIFDIDVENSTKLFKYNPFENKKTPETYLDRMYNSNTNVEKFLLPIIIFINNLCIKLSSVSIIKDNNSYFLLIHKSELINTIKDNAIKSIDILLIPFKILYSENSAKLRQDNYLIFSFNTNGTYAYGKSGETKCWYFLYNNDNKVSHYSNPISQILYDKLNTSTILTRNNFILTNEISKDQIFSVKLDTNPRDYFYTKNNKYCTRIISQDIAYKLSSFVISPSACKIPSLNMSYTGAFVEKLDSKGNKVYRSINHLLDTRYIKFLLFNKNKKLLIPNIDYEIDDENIIRLKNKNNFLDNINKTFYFRFFIPRYNEFFTYVNPLYIKLEYKETQSDYCIYKLSNNLPNNISIQLTREMIYYFIINDDKTEISSNKYEILDNYEIKISKTISTNKEINNESNIYICLLQIKDNLNNPIEERDQIISSYVKDNKSFILSPLDVDDMYLITLDNFICFDQNGKYLPKKNIYGYVYNLNIIKYLLYAEKYNENNILKIRNKIIQDIVCLYNINANQVPRSLNNTVNIPDKNILQNYISLRYKVYNFEDIFYDLMNEFDFSNNDNIKLDDMQRYARFLNYIVTYNQNIFNFYYEEKATTKRLEYAGSTNIKNKFLDINFKNGNSSNDKLLQMKFDKTDISHSYYIFFINHLLVQWMNLLEYDRENDIIKAKNNDLQIYNNIKNGTYLDIFEIKNISNILYYVKTSLKTITTNEIDNEGKKITQKQYSYSLNEENISSENN